MQADTRQPGPVIDEVANLVACITHMLVYLGQITDQKPEAEGLVKVVKETFGKDR